jgi:hypothetical protein
VLRTATSPGSVGNIVLLMSPMVAERCREWMLLHERCDDG